VRIPFGWPAASWLGDTECGRESAAMRCSIAQSGRTPGELLGVPSAGRAFVDHRQHDGGTGRWFLQNADHCAMPLSNAPYFHDGRFDNYEQLAIISTGPFFGAMAARESGRLVTAYLRAIG